MDKNPILFFIRAEHQILINEFTHIFKNSVTQGDWKILLNFCSKQFEQNHHQKEEEFIFQAIQSNPKIKSGGPMCTYFFGIHMDHPSIQIAANAIKQYAQLELRPEWSKLMLDFRKCNLPLVIPGEDHEAGRMILRAVNKLIESNTAELRPIKKLFETYIELQVQHFQREENCLLPMCLDLLPADQWVQIIKKMNVTYPKICSSKC